MQLLFLSGLLSGLVISVYPKEIALFPSSGCYSHDVMMREVGLEFEQDNVTWVQIYMYEFGFGEAKLPQTWTRKLTNRVTDEGNALQEHGSALLWELLVPFDPFRPWDLRGGLLFFNILKKSQQECSRFINSGDFYDKVARGTRFDLIIIDHFLQECVTTMASLLNATTVQFSNWPISDGYVSSLNIPANPSYVATTGTTCSGMQMGFLERATNTVYHLLVVVARTVQTCVINSFYASIGHSQVELYHIEANHLFYAGRSEFLAEPIRPLNNRIKHFGCTTCENAEDYRIVSPRLRTKDWQAGQEQPSARGFANRATLVNVSMTDVMFIQMPLNASLSVQVNCRFNCSLAKIQGNVAPARVVQKVDEKALEASKLRFIQTQEQFPDIDFELLEDQKFVLVSFGSVSKVGNMPKALFAKFVDAFSRLDTVVIWAVNSAPAQFLTESELEAIPENIKLVRWVPIKLLLAHRNLEFFVCHGGVNTLNELLGFGVPIIGMPLQGDQPSNLKRIVELGMGEMIGVNEVWNDQLGPRIAKLLNNLDSYQTRARLISSMITSHRSLSPNRQGFWFNWAKTHGERLKNSMAGPKMFNFFFRTSAEHFAVFDIIFYGFLLTGFVWILSQ